MRRLDGTQIMWVLVHQDSHFGVEVTVYDDLTKAIHGAQNVVKEHADGYDVEYGMNQAMLDDGWVYHAVYSPETGSVHVVEREVQRV